VQLTVTNSVGCQDSTLGRFVKIDGIYLLYIPNAFTPNGDGINEEFKPIGDAVDAEDYTFSIYNRLGELIFQTNNLNNGWNGTYKGKDLPNGVYVWKIRAKEKYSTIIHKDWGNVTLTK
jgi:gliding motility-associated-like protein